MHIQDLLAAPRSPCCPLLWPRRCAAALILPFCAATWQAQTSNTTQDLNFVTAMTSLSALAVGASGTIVRTDDGGATWRVQNSTSNSDYYTGATAPSLTEAWVAGGAGYLMHTTDGEAAAKRLHSGDKCFLLLFAHIQVADLIRSASPHFLQVARAGTK